MRKRIIDPNLKNSLPDDERWLDLTRQAQVELTSEDADFPIEGALDIQGESGWRASRPGKQTIRILFDEPRSVRRILLLFEEEQQPRTQEFMLQWSADGGQSYQEIVRQQYNFSPAQATRELEDYRVNLAGVTAIELSITPDINEGNIPASLARLRMA